MDSPGKHCGLAVLALASRQAPGDLSCCLRPAGGGSASGAKPRPWPAGPRTPSTGTPRRWRPAAWISARGNSCRGVKSTMVSALITSRATLSRLPSPSTRPSCTARSPVHTSRRDLERLLEARAAPLPYNGDELLVDLARASASRARGARILRGRRDRGNPCSHRRCRRGGRCPASPSRR